MSGHIPRQNNSKRVLGNRRPVPDVITKSVKDYINTIASRPAAFAAIQADAKRKGTSGLSMREIDREVAAVRRKKSAP